MATAIKAGDKPVKAKVAATKPTTKPTAGKPAAKKTTKTVNAEKPASAKPAAAKPAAAKPAASQAKTARTVKAAGSKNAGLHPEQRRYYVEVAAYYIAERRGFHGGSQLDDWVQAETEIDRLLREGILKP